MKTTDSIQDFYNYVDELRLRFPVAAISQATGFDKSNVSKVLSRKLEPSTAFLQAVFGHSLWYEDGIYRTPWLHPLFAGKTLELKEKGLLIIQQPSEFNEITPIGRGNGSWVEHLADLWRVVA